MRDPAPYGTLFEGCNNKQDGNGARSLGRRVATLRAALKEREEIG